MPRHWPAPQQIIESLFLFDGIRFPPLLALPVALSVLYQHIQRGTPQTILSRPGFLA